MLCMLKESKKVIKIHSNRLDIYIYCHVERVKSTPHRIKHIKHMSKELKASSIYTVGSNTKYWN